MASRQDWLDAGFAILGEHGAPALTIEQLTARLGLSKGSFYHHFRGMGGFRTALLARFEEWHTTSYIDLVEGEPAAPPTAKLNRLLDLVASKDGGPEVEVAVRAWALQDDEARRTQERVDRVRVDYVRSLWEGISGDAEQAEQVGRLLYLILIGAGQIIPPVAPEELRRLLLLAIRLTPTDREH